jgi:hypothetical protein
MPHHQYVGLGGGTVTPAPTVTGSFDFDTSNPSLLRLSKRTLIRAGKHRRLRIPPFLPA